MNHMRQGTIKGRMVERGHDFYETPAVATKTLIKHCYLPTRIWDPCAGKGALTRVLTEHGFVVVGSDLNAHEGRDADIMTECDFLLLHPFMPSGCDCIVMNPPFSLFDDFVRQALKLTPLVCVFARLVALEGIARSDFMDTSLFRVIAGRERLPMMHRQNWEGNRLKKGAMPFAWFIFNPRSASPGRCLLDRVSWYD